MADGWKAVSFGSCLDSNQAFLNSSAIQARNPNNFTSWEYACGLTQMETDENVIFEGEIIFVKENTTPNNPYGILIAADFTKIKKTSQKVQCVFPKWYRVSEGTITILYIVLDVL